MFKWLFNIFKKRDDVNYDDPNKMKFVTTISHSTRIHKEAPYTDDNFLYMNTLVYTLLENANGKRTYEVISTYPNMIFGAKSTLVFGQVITPWLYGAELPAEYYNWSNVAKNKPTPSPAKKKHGPTLVVNFEEEKKQRGGDETNE